MGSVLGGSANVASYFAGKAVWVTGASSGLGEALCLALCAQAPNLRALVLSARRVEELERVKQLCLELRPGMQIHVLPLDLANLDSLGEAAAAAAKLVAPGNVDVLVNNGGVGFRGFVAETDVATDRHVMNVDFLSGVALVKALLPSWTEARSGHVVQVTSVQGFFGLPCRSAYAAAKHAVFGFYDSLRAEVAEDGISVTTVAPGYIKTGHSLNALRGDGSLYGKLDETTKKGVAPEVLAPRILAGVARRQAELVDAPLDARFARLIRHLCPSLLLCIMRRRAKKERALGAKEDGAAKDA